MVHHDRRPRWGRVATGLAAGLVAALTLVACSSGDNGETDNSGSGPQEQVLTFGLSADPVQPLTGMSQGTAVNQLLALVHRGLTVFDSNGEVQLALAESLDQPDDTTYIFTLREGMTFTDGQAVDAEAVKATLDYFRDKEAGTSLAAALSTVDAINVIDAQTVEITLQEANTAFLEYLALPYAAIVPESALNNETANWIGAGPFTLENLEQGVGATFVKSETYFGQDQVALESIEVKFYPDDDARTNALLSGDVDLIDYVPWGNFDRVADAGFVLNGSNGPFQYVQFNVEDTPFSDPLVRQAVAHAVNRENSVLAAFQSHGTPLSGVSIPETDAAYDPNLLDMWEYDPEKAKDLLAQAGYPDGFDATLLATSQYAFLQDNALSVQEDLRAIGINATLDAPDWSSRISKGGAGEYDIAVSGSTGMSADPGYLLEWVTNPVNYNGSWGYTNDEIAQLIRDGLQASDPDEKHEIYQNIRDLWIEDVPFASLNMREQAYAYTDNVQGFTNLPGNLTFYSGYSFEHVSID